MQIRDEYCSFNRIYKLDGKFDVGKCKIKDIRENLSKAISAYISSLNLSYDIVSPIPNTGGLYTECISKQLNAKECNIFVKETVRKTLGSNKDERENYYDKNLKFIGQDSIEERKILFVDEALLSGLTVKLISKACKENGITNYSFAFMSPINNLSCPFGHISNTTRVISDSEEESYIYQVESFRKEIGAKEMIFMPYSVFEERVGGDSVCKLCFHDCRLK